jgi:hypothetical protein
MQLGATNGEEIVRTSVEKFANWLIRSTEGRDNGEGKVTRMSSVYGGLGVAS